MTIEKEANITLYHYIRKKEEIDLLSLQDDE